MSLLEATLGNSDLISLYTGAEEGEMTRSVILSRRDQESTLLIDNLQFFLCLAIPSALPIDRLLQFMINSYTFTHFKKETVDDEDDADQTKQLVSAVYARNFRLFQQQRDSRLIVTNVDALSPPDHAGSTEKRFKLTFDNHLTLHYFLNRFRRGEITVSGTVFPVTILQQSQSGNGRVTYAKIRCSNREYVEEQFITFGHPCARLTFRFPHSQVIQGGLLHPSSVDCREGTPHKYGELDQMEEEKITFSEKKPSYQSLFVDLTSASPHRIYRVDFAERVRVLSKSSHRTQAKETQKKVTKRKEPPLPKNVPLITSLLKRREATVVAPAGKRAKLSY